MLVKGIFSFLVAAATIPLGLVHGALYPPADIDSGKVLANFSKVAYDTALARIAAGKSTCTKDNVKVRKEWCDYIGFSHGMSRRLI
jgi:tyrosinase